MCRSVLFHQREAACVFEPFSAPVQHQGCTWSFLPPVAKSFACHTSEKSPVTLIIATDPKMPSRKSFPCHTCDPLPPLAAPFPPTRFRHLGSPHPLQARAEISTFNLQLSSSSILPYILPSSVGSKSCVSHSYENCRGGGCFFPNWNALRGFHAPSFPTPNLQTYPSTFVPLVPSFDGRIHRWWVRGFPRLSGTVNCELWTVNRNPSLAANREPRPTNFDFRISSFVSSPGGALQTVNPRLQPRVTHWSTILLLKEDHPNE